MSNKFTFHVTDDFVVVGQGDSDDSTGGRGLYWSLEDAWYNSGVDKQNDNLEFSVAWDKDLPLITNLCISEQLSSLDITEISDWTEIIKMLNDERCSVTKLSVFAVCPWEELTKTLKFPFLKELYVFAGEGLSYLHCLDQYGGNLNIVRLLDRYGEVEDPAFSRIKKYHSKWHEERFDLDVCYGMFQSILYGKSNSTFMRTVKDTIIPGGEVEPTRTVLNPSI